MASVFEEVPPHFCGVDKDGFERMFQTSSNMVNQHIGDLYVQNRFYGEPTLSHKQLVNWIGGYALHTINDTSFRFWSENDNRQDVSPWAQCVWKVINVYAIGFAMANHSFRYNRNVTWNPICEAAKITPVVSVSNRRMSGGNISQALFHRLFPEYFDATNPMMTFAIADVFSTSPNKDNPLFVAFRRAIKAAILTFPYPIPYFWRSAIEYLLLSSPTDTRVYQDKFQNMLVVDDFRLDEHPYESVKETAQQEVEGSDSAYEHYEVDAPVATNVETPDIEEIKSVTPVFNSQYQVAEKVACEGERYQAAFDAPTDPKNAELVKSFLNRLSEQVKKKVISGEYRVNSRGAFAHRVDNKFYLTYPIAVERMYDLLPELGIVQAIPEALFTSFLIDTGALLPVSASINKSNGDVIPIQLAQLHFQLVKLCFIDPENQPNNPDIHIDF